MVEQRRPSKEAILMALQLEAATVADQFSAFINALLNPALDLRLLRGRHDWTEMCFRIGVKADEKGFHRGVQLFSQYLGCPSPHPPTYWQRRTQRKSVV